MTVDLSTRYLGLELKNPLVASSMPLTGKLDHLKQLDQAGIGAVVLPSLFEEQIEHEEMEQAKLSEMGEAFGEAMSYFPKMQGDLRTSPQKYLDGIKEAKAALSVPIIASLNGVHTGGWVRYAKLFEEAGADAIELNVYYVPTEAAGAPEAVEQRYLDLVSFLRSSISIPLAVKVGPYFSSLPSMARRLREAGADGLVLFNRFMQPDYDLEERSVTSNVELSSSVELRLPLRWVAILAGQVEMGLAATSGIHTAQDALKVLAAGADVAMMASALLANGPQHIGVMLDGMIKWLETHEFASVSQFRGSLSQKRSGNPELFERANYMKALITYSK